MPALLYFYFSHRKQMLIGCGILAIAIIIAGALIANSISSSSQMIAAASVGIIG